MIFINAILATISVPLSLITLSTPKEFNSKIILRDDIWKSIKKICLKKESILDILCISACNILLYLKLLVMVGVIQLFLVFNK